MREIRGRRADRYVPGPGGLIQRLLWKLSFRGNLLYIEDEWLRRAHRRNRDTVRDRELSLWARRREAKSPVADNNTDPAPRPHDGLLSIRPRRRQGRADQPHR